MKKKTLIILFLIVAVILCLIPIKRQKTIPIQAQYFLVFQQLIKPENWKNWQPNLVQFSKINPAQIKITKVDKGFIISAPQIILNVDNTEGFGFTITKKIGGKNSMEHLIALPNNLNRTTSILQVQKQNIFQLIYHFFDQKNGKSDAFGLKNYMEDARLYYGFDIKKTTVTDSNVVVIKRVVPTQNRLAEIKKIQFELSNFIKKQGLKKVQPVIADIRNVGQDSLRMMVGIPINQQTSSLGKIQFMHLPTHGRMLTGLFTGRYGNRQKLYLAMKNYISDHNLASPEDPYEKYLDNKIPLNDSSLVRLQVNFPIY